MAAPLPVSAKDLIPFTPSVYESDAEKPVYRIAVPTLMSKPRWEREVAAAGAVRITEQRTAEFLRDAVTSLLHGDARDTALRDLDSIAELRERQANLRKGEEFTDEDKLELMQLVGRIAELGDWAAQQWPPYAELVAQQDYWFTMSRILAARHFLRGWEGVTEVCGVCQGIAPPPAAEGAEPVPCAKCQASGRVPLKFALRDGLLDPALLEKLPRGDVLDVGFKAMTLMRVDWERRKN